MGRPMATSQDFVNWVCGPDLNSAYLRYLLLLEQESIRRFAHGTTHQTMYYPEAKALTVLVPARSDQDAIAEVLSALDDKIAANERAIRGSLNLAAAHFQATVAGVGFSTEIFTDVASVNGGGTPRTSVGEYWGGSIQWATPTDVTGLNAPYLRRTSRSITEEGLAACASSLYPTGSILMTSRATIGAFAIAQQPTAVNQGFIVVNAKRADLQWWLFHEMQDRVPEFLTHANGATFLELSRGRFRDLVVRLPEAQALQAFNRVVQPLHELAASISEENEKLAAARDEFLPLLMSGRLRVKDVAA
jgi:type I restriction enzyme S subunit